jgi:hypothetical protein
MLEEDLEPLDHGGLIVNRKNPILLFDNCRHINVKYIHKIIKLSIYQTFVVNQYVQIADLKGFGYNRPSMSEPKRIPAAPPTAPKPPDPASDKVLCERCGAEMFRMHAVWRCPTCGYKTDCCGW